MSTLILPPDLQDEEIARCKAQWQEKMSRPPFVPYPIYKGYGCFLFTQHVHQYRWAAWLCGWWQLLWLKIRGDA